MNTGLSANTQVILMLTAPLLAGPGSSSDQLLTQGEYKRFARQLREANHSPEDLLGADASSVLRGLGAAIDVERIQRLLARGFQLSQAMERWSSRAIWVLSRADEGYPARLKQRLRDDAPAVLYGCGETSGMEGGGLAVVGSRRVDDALLEYTREIGRLAARAGRGVVSGGARGVDRAAMEGALQSGGVAIGVMADGLEKAAMARDNREFLMQGQLTLLSPYDPAAGFNVGNAMQRNKVIYALADAALVVNSDHNKGGTWAGATEQLDKRHLVPVYIRSTGESTQGLAGLRQRGAIDWPNPETPEALSEMLSNANDSDLGQRGQEELFSAMGDEDKSKGLDEGASSQSSSISQGSTAMANPLFSRVRELLMQLDAPVSEADVATLLGVLPGQARTWLQRLVEEGSFVRHARPVRYEPRRQASLLE